MILCNEETTLGQTALLQEQFEKTGVVVWGQGDTVGKFYMSNTGSPIGELPAGAKIRPIRINSHEAAIAACLLADNVRFNNVDYYWRAGTVTWGSNSGYLFRPTMQDQVLKQLYISPEEYLHMTRTVAFVGGDSCRL